MSSSLPGTSAARWAVYLGMDVRKDSITLAVLQAEASGPSKVERLPNDLASLRRFLDRLGKDAQVQGLL